MAKSLLFVYNHVYPFVAAPWLWWLWTERGASMAFVAWVFAVPAAFGWVMAGIATNVQRRWEFRGPLLAGRYFIHHGLIYASTMALGLYVAMDGRDDPARMWAVPLSMACIVGFVGWWHDSHAVDRGMIVSHHPLARAGADAWHLVAHYGPTTFGSMGLAHGSVAVWAWSRLQSPSASATDWWLCFGIGVAAMTVAGGVTYGWSESRAARNVDTHSA